MSKKASKTGQPASSKKKAASKKATTGDVESRKDVKGFVDHLHTNKAMQKLLQKGWSEVIKMGKQKGYKFTRQELYDHIKERYGVTNAPELDDPATCICIK